MKTNPVGDRKVVGEPTESEGRAKKPAAKRRTPPQSQAPVFAHVHPGIDPAPEPVHTVARVTA